MEQRRTTNELMVHLPKVIAALAESYILEGYALCNHYQYGSNGHWELAMSLEPQNIGPGQICINRMSHRGREKS